MMFDTCHGFVEKQDGGEKEVDNSSFNRSWFVDLHQKENFSRTDESIPVGTDREDHCFGDSIVEKPEHGHIYIPCGPMSSWQSSQTMPTPTRPTKDEASDLLEIMSTPPANYALPRDDSERVYRRDFDQDSLSIVSPNELPSCVSQSSHTVTYTIPKIKSGPPYESYLEKNIFESHPIQSFQLMIDSEKRLSLLPCLGDETTKQKLQNASSKKCNHFGMGPYLGILPESIIYYTISFIEYSERHPTLQLISHGMTSFLRKPELFLEMKRAFMKKDHSETSPKRSSLSQFSCDETFASPTSLNELLFVVGGKFPTKPGNAEAETHAQSEDGHRIHRRMTMQSNTEMGIIGYDLRKKNWIRFGGDPMQPFASNFVSYDNVCSTSKSSPSHLGRKEALHPLSPFGIVDAQPLYLGHPHYSLLFFGGTHQDTDLPSSRVIGYSFLSAKWELWPEMLRPRYGDDFVLARVGVRDNETDEMAAKFPYLCGDSVVLIGCDLEFCDCFRCSTAALSQSSSEKDGDETINFDANCFPSEEKSRNTRADLDFIGRCEILDLTTRTWKTRKSKPPSSPPDDGGVAVLGGRYVFLPGTCPPPPKSSSSTGSTTCWNHSRENLDESMCITEAVTPLSQSETNSDDGIDASTSSIHDAVESEEVGTTSMDIDHGITLHEGNKSNDDDDISNDIAAAQTPSHLLHYRPGLVYDSWRDTWSTLPPRPYVTTSSPTTCTYENRVLVMGGYRSSSENALSCYRHREDDCILDYEDHLDYVWWFSHGHHGNENDDSNILGGKWTFGGGTTSCGYSQSWASSGDISSAVEAAAALQREQQLQITKMQQSHIDGIRHGVGDSCGVVGCVDKNIGRGALPCHAPASVRGASTTIYRGRLTMLGGLSTFSRTFYDEERRSIWQYFPERREWRKLEMTLPVPALLDGYAFYLHI